MQILKKEVDDHHPENKTIPHCELVAKWTIVDKEVKVKSLIHTINILGTTYEETFFTINIEPGM